MIKINQISVSKKLLAVTLLAIYILIRFNFESGLLQISEYGTYLFEILFTALSLVMLKLTVQFKFERLHTITVLAIISAIIGSGIFIIAHEVKLTVPINLHLTETIFSILLVAPLLEEMLFRGALWEIVLAITGSKYVALAFTSLFFSFGHLWAYWNVPKEYHSFVLYQSAYTLLLGAACGTLRIKKENITSPILVHFGFNAGFILTAYIKSMS